MYKTYLICTYTVYTMRFTIYTNYRYLPINTSLEIEFQRFNGPETTDH